MKIKEFIQAYCWHTVYGAVEHRQKNDYIEANPLGFNYWYYNTRIVTLDTQTGILKFNALGYSASTTKRHRMVAVKYQVLQELNEAIKQGAESFEVRVM